MLWPAMARRKKSKLEGITRRMFVHRLTFMGGGVILLGSACKDEPKPSSPGEKTSSPVALTSSHLTFTDPEFKVMAAAVDRVLPKDQDPGALEANVPEYIDRALQAPQLRRMKDDFLGGLAALDRRAQRMFKKSFDQATAAQQDELITLFKDSPESSGEYKWFEILVVLTMEGFLGDPSYGGNKNKVGWALMGFDLVGGMAVGLEPGYDGQKNLGRLLCGGGKGC